MSDDVMRYNQCDRYLSEGGGEMEQDEQGDWVLYSDLRTQLAQRDAALKAADDLWRAVDFLADNDPDDIVCDGGGTAILVGLSGIRKSIAAYRKARGQDA